jgi:hypothetical protein
MQGIAKRQHVEYSTYFLTPCHFGFTCLGLGGGHLTSAVVACRALGELGLFGQRAELLKPLGLLSRRVGLGITNATRATVDGYA